MSGTTAAATSTEAASDEPGLPIHPTDILLELIVAFLTPMFMSASSGDLSFARLAAMETLGSYRARTQKELMHIAQIIGFGLAAMDSLCLSMADEASLTMKLRLRSNANALNRSAQQNVRVLDKSRSDNTRHAPAVAERPSAATARPEVIPAFDEDNITEADVQASIGQARAMVKEAHARMREADQAAQKVSARQATATQPVHADPRPTRTSPTQRASAAQGPLGQLPAVASEQLSKLMWANAMTEVAGELVGDLANVPPADRRGNMRWADALGSSASHLALSAGYGPPTPQVASPKTATGPKQR